MVMVPRSHTDHARPGPPCGGLVLCHAHTDWWEHTDAGSPLHTAVGVIPQGYPPLLAEEQHIHWEATREANQGRRGHLDKTAPPLSLSLSRKPHTSRRTQSQAKPSQSQTAREDTTPGRVAGRRSLSLSLSHMPLSFCTPSDLRTHGKREREPWPGFSSGAGPPSVRWPCARPLAFVALRCCTHILLFTTFHQRVG